ncbi:MAG: DUF6544 family protein [Chloroflexota bacterium]
MDNDHFLQTASALLSDLIRGEAVDNRSARVYLNTPSWTVSVVFHFNERDEIVNFVAER